MKYDLEIVMNSCYPINTTVGDSVNLYVKQSVWDSVTPSVYNSVEDCVWQYLRISIKDSMSEI